MKIIPPTPITDGATFSRASTATYFDADGVLQTAAIDEPRWNHEYVDGKWVEKGLLREEQRTNLLTYSEALGHSSWGASRTGVISNAAVAPDGDITAAKVFAKAELGEHYVDKTVAVVSGQMYVSSIFAKAGELKTLRLRTVVNTPDLSTRFDLVTGTIQGNGHGEGKAGIVPIGNGWFRIWVVFTPSATGSTIFRVQLYDTDGTTPSYTGDGTSGLYIWGAQLEQGSFPTSYIPTPATFTSRASTATYFDEAGVLRTAAADVARYGYGYVDGQWVSKGLVLEGQATNLLRRSADFVDNVWGKARSSVNPSATVSPDPSSMASKLIADTQSGAHYVEQQFAAENKEYVFSFFVKAAEETALVLYLLDPSGSISVGSPTNFNLVTGTVASGPGAIVDVGGGWYRVSTRGTIAAPGTARARLLLRDGTPYIGNDVAGLYIWGAQLEEGSTASSYSR